MGSLLVGGVLFAAGLVTGLNSGSRRIAGPAVATLLGALLVLALILVRWVLAVDPTRDTGTVPLPAPWFSVLPVLALGLMLALPAALGGFVGFSVCDFMSRSAWRWLRLVGYAMVFLALAAYTPWIVGVTFD